MRKIEPNDTATPSLHNFIFPDFNIADLSTTHILQNSVTMPETEKRGYFDIQPHEIDLQYGSFRIAGITGELLKVVIRQNERSVQLYCDCSQPKRKLCEHQAQVLYNLMKRKDLRAFFDHRLRYDKIRVLAADYGLENEIYLDDYFELTYTNRELHIRPRLKELLPVDDKSVTALEESLVPARGRNLPVDPESTTQTKKLVVIGLNKYYEHFYTELYEAPTTRDGKIKNPVTALNPMEQVWKTEDPDTVKFLTAIAGFQNNFRKQQRENDIGGFRAILKNPLHAGFYYHNPEVSENVNAASLVPVNMQQIPVDLQLHIDQKPPFYQISGELILDGIYLDLEKVQQRFNYFVLYTNSLYLIDREDILNIISFFKQHNQKIFIHQSKFEAFRQNLLSKLENRIKITYSYLKPATERQKEEAGIDIAPKKLVYLEDFGNYVLITPVMQYGKVEVPLFSRKEIYAVDSHGHPFTVARDNTAEIRFSSALIRQHPDFEEQLGRDFVYLHKGQFLDENWFLDAFEEWQNQGIHILGFNTLTKNKLNLNKASISVSVESGINWFNTVAAVKFGKQQVTLKHLHKAVKNRTKYVELGDGTMGILPEQWIDKFSKFFEMGEVSGELIRMPKSSFVAISELYEEEVLTREVKEQIAFFKTNLNAFETIQPVDVPSALQASLREYQKEGLNWLNFLDEFNFGGCLADDMGLGKTVQIIAFLLSQKEKRGKSTSLIIVPTSLIFNWQAEAEKFAPSLKVLTIYGADRQREVTDFDYFDIVLTSYGTLLSDVNFLKKYIFNYIILDESQAIKNPESQRYKAARLLQSRNKLVLTGTPVENNTFDLYGQLSFASPGLLGNKTQFRNHYSIPIDRFKDSDRARELQRRINPFVLRRTKKQVATELPDKTEMILYCEMGDEQRKVYNAYELEFYTFLNTRNEVDIPRETLHILQGLTKLRQICNSPALLNDDAYYGSSSAKIDVLMEQIESKSPQHKILVFSQFVTMLDLIKTELTGRNIAFEYLTGQTKDREARVNNFQNNPDVRVFLISLKAGGTGLNLTEADYVYLIDPWWNPAVENQAIDRSYRIGQKKNVIAVRLICPGTIEEKIMELQSTKKELANDLVKTDNSVLKTLSKNDLLGLVSH
ncbi:DEAD/DEAH box helicase [Dyadobacter aurulentus]|uniref:DEAD/DEAH box helicase n=1 Tax=Dyadobacter sp. UC 10 TaxID=2605428 RepID=UPI0011F15C25|nr:DEAD/DEAH box helicase [Dyadobacter sp. UC 10]KAA0993697.1 DEAD/DEAH box helicase [Dyadobacter sp. UC 10]